MPLVRLLALAREILPLLEQTQRRIVCAESCTAGLVSAALAGIPGASQWLCGSAVVYRNETKTAWIGVSRELLDDPHRGDVCEETALRMAEGVLAQTPEASVSVSVTGHLGPGAPAGLDGVIYIGWAERTPQASQPVVARCQRVELQTPAPLDGDDITRRVARQTEATQRVLQVIREALGGRASTVLCPDRDTRK